MPAAAGVRRSAARFTDAAALAGETWTAENPLAAAEIARPGCQPGRLDHAAVHVELG